MPQDRPAPTVLMRRRNVRAEPKARPPRTVRVGEVSHQPRRPRRRVLGGTTMAYMFCKPISTAPNCVKRWLGLEPCWPNC
jgi:hypothetical protein